MRRLLTIGSVALIASSCWSCIEDGDGDARPCATPTNAAIFHNPTFHDERLNSIAAIVPCSRLVIAGEGGTPAIDRNGDEGTLDALDRATVECARIEACDGLDNCLAEADAVAGLEAVSVEWKTGTLGSVYSRPFCAPFTPLVDEPIPAWNTALILNDELIAIPMHAVSMQTNCRLWYAVRKVVLNGPALSTAVEVRRIVSCRNLSYDDCGCGCRVDALGVCTSLDSEGITPAECHDCRNGLGLGEDVTALQEFNSPSARENDLVICRVSKPWKEEVPELRSAAFSPDPEPAQLFGHPWQLALKEIEAVTVGGDLWVESYSGCSGGAIFRGSEVVGMYLGHGSARYQNWPCTADGVCNTASRCFREPQQYLDFSAIKVAMDRVVNCPCAGRSVCKCDVCGQGFSQVPRSKREGERGVDEACVPD